MGYYTIDYSTGEHKNVFYGTKVFTDYEKANECFEQMKSGKYHANYAWICSAVDEDGEIARLRLIDIWFDGDIKWIKIKDRTRYKWVLEGRSDIDE